MAVDKIPTRRPEDDTRCPTCGGSAHALSAEAQARFGRATHRHRHFRQALDYAVKIVVREIVEREFVIDEQEFRDWYGEGSEKVADDELDEMVTHTDNWGRDGSPPAFLVPTDSPAGWREIYEIDRTPAAAPVGGES